MINKLDFASPGLLTDGIAVADAGSLGVDRQLFAALLAGTLPQEIPASGSERAPSQAFPPMEAGIEVRTGASGDQPRPAIGASGLDSEGSLADTAVSNKPRAPLRDELALQEVSIEVRAGASGDQPGPAIGASGPDSEGALANTAVSIKPRAALRDELALQEASEAGPALPSALVDLQTPLDTSRRQVEWRASNLGPDTETRTHVTAKNDSTPAPASTSAARAASALQTMPLAGSGAPGMPMFSAPLQRGEIMGGGISAVENGTPDIDAPRVDIRPVLSGAGSTPHSRTTQPAEQARVKESPSAVPAGPALMPPGLTESAPSETMDKIGVDLDGDTVMLRVHSSGQSLAVLSGTAQAGRELFTPTSSASVSEAPMPPPQSRSELTSSLFEISREASRAWLREIGLQGTAQLQPGGGRIMLQLHPAELGYLEIEILSQDAAASIEFVSQSAGTRDLIEQSLPRLRELLQEQGLQLSGLQVRSQARQQQDQPQHERSYAPQDLEVPLLDDSARRTVAAASGSVGRNVLDVYA